MIRVALLSVSSALVAASVALADTRDHSLAEGQLLLQSCESQAPTLRAMCLGYLAAVADDVRRSMQQGDPAACLPAVTNLEAYRVAFIGFARAQPGAASRPSFDLARDALATQWPCS